jgi:hypothetical protein
MSNLSDWELEIERKAQLNTIRCNPDLDTQGLADLFDMLGLFPHQRDRRRSPVKLYHPNEEKSCVKTEPRNRLIP